MKLNNTSQKPLYSQLKQILKEAILRGTYKAGQQLPPESELCETYGVSRITARRAISDLVEEGILHRQQGKGTFVKETKVKRELISVGGFSELTMASGKTPSSQILSNTVMAADETLAAEFGIPAGDPVLKLHRLLFIDNEPFIIETSHYPLRHLPDLEKHIGESASTYSILKSRYGAEMSRSVKSLEVVFASEYEAELFRCDRGAPLFVIEKKSSDKSGRVLHLSHSLFMTSKVIFTLDTDKADKGDFQAYGEW
ncbi:DNA-binding transcriptional regulator FrlR [Paenibacillus mucilaginosus 3016]|uniref:DNA-binding transcriptional regulator FrlR n=2 Tax=Paenibacillus mucilaginosus TaxID=61624 RepID=H6NP71_9BACL|nr:UTRA domain-containing protein [Paenibacillus mucilaginosus]AFC31781.1 DNA-binding transcriptional regulator FrlR [Paenibacillus mucilaginosus 3016]AFH64136.1 transcriptional regulator [Paenibacillus mucilaginosus K02]WFA20297.1 UTRA domain-containing protein [Paenibacillus mucilaginosus]